MPADIQLIADPALIVLAWAAGLGLVAGIIAWADIVGPGFIWLTSGVGALLAIPGALADHAWWARAGLAAIVFGLLMARKRVLASVLLMAGGVALVVEGALVAGWVPAVTASIALGGVTGEMMLGHWYLIDPRLPRQALRNLSVAGIAGLMAEAGLEVSLAIGFAGGAVGFWILLVTSVVLMVAVIAALRYPAYSGVMAATGLSYLALLTTLGAVFVGRAIAAGLGPFNL